MRVDNRGFSMVELIIVIAIMAILVGIVGSQVLPYLNQSKEAKDRQVLSGWVTASTSAYAMNAGDLVDVSYDIVVTSSGVDPVSGTNGSEIREDFIEMSGLDASAPFQVFSSKLYQRITKLTFTVKTEVDGGRNAVCICNIEGVNIGSISTTELVSK